MIVRLRLESGDPQADDGNPVFERVESAQRFTEYFADAVNSRRPELRVDRDVIAQSRETNRVMGASEDDTRHPYHSCRVEDVVSAVDVHVANDRPRILPRDP